MAATPCLEPASLFAYAEGTKPSAADAEHLTGCPRCRAALVTAMARTLPSGSSGDGATLALPRALERTDRYVAVRTADGQPAELGTGGFARVALARDERLGREVALRHRMGSLLSDWLSHSRELGDDARAAWLWARVAGRALAWQSLDEARSAARRCLELVKPESTEPRMRAASVWCHLVELDASDLSDQERLARRDQLWTELPTDDSWERHVTAEYLASSTSMLRMTLGLPTGDWPARAREHTEAVARLRPNAPESWTQLSATLVSSAYQELNALRGEAALALAARAVEVARQAHALGRTDQTLFAIADALVDLLVMHHFHPELVSAVETARVVAEARRQLEAVLEINPEDEVARRRYLFLLLEVGAFAELAAQLALLPAENADAPTAFAALVGGPPDLALSLAPKLGDDIFDGALLEAMALERKGDLPGAARAARAAAALPFVTAWPLETMPRWAQAGSEPLRRLVDDLGAAQRANDNARARAALERFADDLSQR